MLVPSLIGEIRNSVDNYSSELFSLKLQAVNIRKSVCNLDDVIGMVQTSTQIQEQKAEALEAFSQKTEEFTAEAARIDEDAAAVVVGILSLIHICLLMLICWTPILHFSAPP